MCCTRRAAGVAPCASSCTESRSTARDVPRAVGHAELARRRCRGRRRCEHVLGNHVQQEPGQDRVPARERDLHRVLVDRACREARRACRPCTASGRRARDRASTRRRPRSRACRRTTRARAAGCRSSPGRRAPAIHAAASPGTGSSVFGSSAVSVGYWRFHTSRAIALSPCRRSSEPIVAERADRHRNGCGAPARCRPSPAATRTTRSRRRRTDDRERRDRRRPRRDYARAPPAFRARSRMIWRVAFRPGMPVTPPPPCVALLAWYRPAIGVRKSA